MSSRERLDMDNMKNTANLSFNQKKGCFVARWTMVLLVLVALLLVIVVGLLVGYLAPCGSVLPLTDPDAETDETRKPLPYVLLPRDVVPEHYDVELQPFIYPGNFTFHGTVRIVMLVVGDADNVTVHAHDLAIEEASVSLRSVGDWPQPEVTLREEDAVRQFYVLHVRPRLRAGQKLELVMRFKGNLNDQLVGFYRSSYSDEDGNKQWLATTQFQPTDARRAFPCFDEPALKATFNMTIVRWRNMTSISNMPVYKSEARGEDWMADYFEKTVKMSTYLLAFVVSDFKSKGTPQFSVWSRAGALNTTSYALDVGPRILKFYETFFNIKFPLPKTDMVAIPDFNAGAMENWGLITYRETALLYDPRYSSAANKMRVAVVVSHELAHQWFGNLVTPKWWDDLWLNEGFASYVEYLGVEAIHPEWRMDEQFVLDDLQDVMELDSLKTSHPISVPVGHPDEINEIFDRISYAKGASLIRMMKYFLGDKNFRNGLTNYLNAKKFGNAVQDDLWEHLTAVQGKEEEAIDVKSVMDSWTLQTGYPVVTITRNYNRGTAAVNQNRFLLEKTDGVNSASYEWEVPFTYTDGLNPNWEPKTKLWLHKTNGTISGLPGPTFWVIANVQQVGYYRVNYDEDNWRLLINQFQNDHTKIHAINRAQIMDDALDLARAGLMSYSMAMNASLYLNQEREYLPWKAALSSFSFIELMLGRTPLFGKWKTYLKRQLEPMYERVGWEEAPDENILQTFMRGSTLAWMCSYEYKNCVSTAIGKFEEWRKDPENTQIISPNLRSLIMCIAVRNGGEDVWDFIWSRYQNATRASEKDKFMYSLSCAREPWLLTRYLNWSLSADSGIRRQDGSSVFKYIGSKLYGRDLTFNYMRDKWGVIFDRYGKSFFAISNMLKSVTASLSTPFDLQQLKEFYKLQRNKLGTAKRAFEQSIEKAQANVKWMDANYPVLKDWLDSVV